MKNNSDQPDAYQKGWVEFYKLKFKVTPDVLIPRPETELLVDHVLNVISQLQPVPCKLSPIIIFDLGTGSGNIAISIALNLQRYLTLGVRVKTIATDISEKALNIARQNARFHGVENKIKFVQSDLLSAFLYSQTLRCHPKGGKVKNNLLQGIDIIVTNLPYIPSARIPYLDSSVKDFEPWVALDGGRDGFELYRKLFQQITKFSLPPWRWKPKLIVGEIDYTHAELAISEAQKYFPEAKIEVKTDLAHKQRILSINFL